MFLIVTKNSRKVVINIKGDLLCFFCVFVFASVCYIGSIGSSSVPQKTLLLNNLVTSPAFYCYITMSNTAQLLEGLAQVCVS